MDVGEILKKDLACSFDILEYQYDIRSKLRGRNARTDDVEVYIHFSDFDKANISRNDFYTALRFLAKEVPDIVIVSMYDIVNEDSPWQDDPEDHVSPKFAEVSLPTNFKNIARQWRNKYASEPKITGKQRISRERTKPKSTFVFTFAISSGELSRFPAKMYATCKFDIKKNRSKLIEILIEEKLSGPRYVQTSDLTSEAGYRNAEKCRGAIHSIRATVSDTHKDIGLNDFIEGQQSEGYRIGEKISISFEDTP